MTTPLVPYIGNAPYCFANATAMLLASAGEQVSPACVEVLTGVGLGAMWMPDRELFFFSMEAPDVGISRALELLGFTFLEGAGSDEEEPPFDDLAEVLTAGPAVLGPLEMGLLTYVPGRGTPFGADHYVLAYGVRDGEVYVHDPGGFPHVSLPLEQLAEAWRAELIFYRRRPYRWWSSPRRIREVAVNELEERAIEAFQEIYRQADRVSRPGVILGTDAIRRLAARAAAHDLPRSLVEQMAGFLFQLGARRALDYASFFGNRYPTLAELKQEQAVLFGRCHMLAVREDWNELARELEYLAGVEDQFRATLLGGDTTRSAL